MKNFDFKNPTKILFGKNQIASIESEISKNEKILMVYGGGSIKQNGIFNQVTSTLKEHTIIEFGGIPPNPEFDVLMKAVDIIKNEKITFILAVGGGSVIDGTKFLSAAAYFNGDDFWEILTSKKPITKGLPFGTVLTLPATGSEMNSGAVITRERTKEKLVMGGPGLFPVFSVLDPQVVSSIPKRQIANGITDAYMHVLEQYLTYPANALLQDRFAESILQTLKEVGPIVFENPSDYNAAANFMWSCTMALNGLIQKGVPTDWAVHMMGHELTALFGIDHARTLAIIAGNHYTYNLETKKEKLAQYGERVWGIKEGSTIEKATLAIDKTISFFQSLGIETSLSSYTNQVEGTAQEISKRFNERGWFGLGEHGKLTPKDVEKIVEMSY